MIMFDGFAGLIVLAGWIFCFIDVVTTPQSRCRNLPKLAWVFIVLLFMVVGSIAWLLAGRPWAPKGTTGPGGTVRVRTTPTNPDDDEEFLAGLNARAEEQRRRSREADSGDDPA
jgi:hypothetical protein